MQERIKALRRELNLTQAKFAERLGIKPNTISQYESGRNEPIDAVIALICREFGVSELWLRTGEGEMFEATPETQLDELSKEYNLDELDRKMMLGYLKLSAAERTVIKQYMQNVLDGMETNPQQPDPFIPAIAQQSQPAELISTPSACWDDEDDEYGPDLESDMATRVAALESQLAAEKSRADRAEAEARKARAEAKARTDELLEVYREDEAAAAEGWKELPVER